MKERLTGAIILVVLIVLLVPELLSGPSRSAPVPQAAATSSEEPPLRSYTIDLADESHPAAASANPSNASPGSSGPAQPTPIVEPPTAQQPAAGSATEGSAGQTDSAPQPTTAAAAGSQDLAPEQQSPVQRPATPPNEQQPTATLPTGQHATTLDKASAQERTGAAGKSSPAGEWTVQLGVFRNHANAERLVQQLKNQGFHALLSETGNGDHHLWRVRAGPVADRASAEQLNARLRTAGHAGSVVPK